MCNVDVLMVLSGVQIALFMCNFSRNMEVCKTLNPWGTGAWKSTALKLKLDESAEYSQGANAACMALNVLNDHCEFEIGLKQRIRPRGKAFFIKRPHHHAPHSHFCTQIEHRSPANCSVIFVISSSDREFLVSFGEYV
jgi:hypothetical protein